MSTLSNVTVYRFSKGTSYYLTKRLANGDMRYDTTQRTLAFGTEREVQILAVQADGDELSELQPHGDQSDQVHPPVQHRDTLYAPGMYPQRPVRHRLGGKPPTTTEKSPPSCFRWVDFLAFFQNRSYFLRPLAILIPNVRIVPQGGDEGYEML